MSEFLRVWASRGFQKNGRCRTCHTPFRLHTRRDTGKPIPLALAAKPLRVDVEEETGAHIAVYAWSDVHRCPKKHD